MIFKSHGGPAVVRVDGNVHSDWDLTIPVLMLFGFIEFSIIRMYRVGTLSLSFSMSWCIAISG